MKRIDWVVTLVVLWVFTVGYVAGVLSPLRERPVNIVVKAPAAPEINIPPGFTLVNRKWLETLSPRTNHDPHQ